MSLIKKQYLDMLACGFRDRSATHINAMVKTASMVDNSNGNTLERIHDYLRHVGKGRVAIDFFVDSRK